MSAIKLVQRTGSVSGYLNEPNAYITAYLNPDEKSIRHLKSIRSIYSALRARFAGTELRTDARLEGIAEDIRELSKLLRRKYRGEVTTARICISLERAVSAIESSLALLDAEQRDSCEKWCKKARAFYFKIDVTSVFVDGRPFDPTVHPEPDVLGLLGFLPARRLQPVEDE